MKLNFLDHYQAPGLKSFLKLLRGKRLPKNKYKRIEFEIQSKAAWLGSVTIPLAEDDSTESTVKNRMERRASHH